MSRDSAAGEFAFARLRARIDAALPRVAFFVVPSAVGFIVLGQAIVSVLLQHGKFTHIDSERAWAVLAGSSVGLLASALGRLYSSAFYAMRDTRTPLRFAIIRVLLTGILGYLFAFPVPRALGLPAWVGAAGLTASAGISGWVEFLLLRHSVARRIGKTGIPRTLLAKLWISALIAGGVGYLVMRSLSDVDHTLRGLAAIATFAIVYAIGTLSFAVPEARALWRRILRR
jgi:putative peptidoglycan lipid II flippase